MSTISGVKGLASREQKIAYAILCAKEVCQDKKWNEWADKWLDGTDRTEKSACSAGIRAYRLRENSAWAAARSATWLNWTEHFAIAAERKALQSSFIPIDLVAIAQKARECY